MLTDLETLLNANQFGELVKAINENRDFSFNQNGLTVESKSTDGSLHLTIKYDSSQNEENLVKQEREKFLELIKEIDDNVFVEVCENLGSELINKMQNAINGTNLEAARSAILRFKSEASKLLVSRINYYKECLVKLDK